MRKRYDKVDDELSSANHRIQYELEPRLKEVGYADNVDCEQVISKYDKDIESINYWKSFYEDILENGYKE